MTHDISDRISFLSVSLVERGVSAQLGEKLRRCFASSIEDPPERIVELLRLLEEEIEPDRDPGSPAEA
jgi:hypothetical protein